MSSSSSTASRSKVPADAESKTGASRSKHKDGATKDGRKRRAKGGQPSTLVAGEGERAASSSAKRKGRGSKSKKASGKKSPDKKGKRGKSGKAKRKPKLTAKSADPHVLYQLAVQSPEYDVRFLQRVYKKRNGRAARHLREDFCGTAYLLAEWLAKHPENSGEGFDIDADTIQWGIDHNFEEISDWRDRLELHVADVREPSTRPPDIRNAPNFSWMVFTERGQMMEYFRGVQDDLAEDGLFILDIYGGPEAFEEMEDERKVEGGFTYVWDQKSYHPATGGYHCAIHFRFSDGSELRNVYDYRWRLWNLPEVVDMLREAGFSQVDSYWEGTDADGVSGNGVYRKHSKGENCPAWVTWIVAQK